MISIEYLIIISLSLLLILTVLPLIEKTISLIKKVKSQKIVIKLREILEYIDSQRYLFKGEKHIKLKIVDKLYLSKEGEKLNIKYRNFETSFYFSCDLKSFECSKEIIIHLDGKGNCWLECD
jgi:hypothetical protein